MANTSLTPSSTINVTLTPAGTFDATQITVSNTSITDGTQPASAELPVGTKGDIGQKGQKGTKGSKGDKGQKGEKGQKGLKGEKGQKGTTGDKGQKGEKGEIGQKGEKGQKGLKGQKGQKGTTGDKGQKGEKGQKGQKGLTGDKGQKGIKGQKGLKGQLGSFGGRTVDYTFDTQTADSDPGTGTVRLNNANPSSATLLFIDDEDDSGTNIESFLRTIDDSDSVIKGHVRISLKFDTTTFMMFAIDGNSTESTGYFKVPVSYVTGSGTITNADDVLLTFARTGDQGDTGEKGQKGQKGLKGQKGQKGVTGDKGQKGEKGQKGLKGIKGNDIITGTPVDNQLAVFANSTAIEGDANLTWDGSQLTANGNASFVSGGVQITSTNNGLVDAQRVTAPFIISNNQTSLHATRGLTLASGRGIHFNGTSAWHETPDLVLERDAANTLAQRNGTNAQTFNIYNTYTDASNYERASLKWNSDVFEFSSEALGTGTARNFSFTGGNVGIGTTTPSEKLDVDGNALVRGDIVSRDTYPSIYVNHSGTLLGGIRADATTKLELKTITSAPLSFQVDSDEKMRITDDGRVGLGTLNPVDKIHIFGDGEGLTLQQSVIGSTFNGITFRTYTNNDVVDYKLNQSTGEFKHRYSTTYYPTWVYGTTEAMRIDTTTSSIQLSQTPTAPTAPTGTNTTQIATTAFVQAAVDTYDTLAELTDVTISTVGDEEFLVYDTTGGHWRNRTLLSTDIPSLDAVKITTGTFADARISQSSVTQHQAALSITESQISDLGSYITASSTDTLTNKSGNISQWTNDSGYLTSFTETNDLSTAVTWANVPDANITQSSVTQHEGALTIAQSQVTNLTTDLAAKAPLASPALTGTPTAPTAASGTNTTQLATTAFVSSEITNDVTKAFVDALNVDADTLDGQDGSYYLDYNNFTNAVTGLNDLSDVTLSTPGSGDLLRHNGAGQFVNTTLIAGDIPNLDAAKIASGTFADARISQSSVTQYEGALTIAQSQVTNLTTDLASKAPLASPALTGTPTAPTAASGTNTTQLATTAFVSTAVSDLVDSAPTTLDTLNELAAALGDDPNFATTVTNSIATKAAISGTPVNNQVAVWTNATTIEGDSGFTWSGSIMDISSASNVMLRLNSSDNDNARVLFQRGNVAKWNIGLQGSDDSFTFYDSPNNKAPIKIISGADSNTIYVDSTSNIGIGNNSPSEKLTVNGSISVLGVVHDTDTATLTSTSATQIAAFPTTHLGAKIIVQAADTVSGERQMSELLLVHDGTTTSLTEYAIIFTNASLADYTAAIVGSNVVLYATGASTNSTTYKVYLTQM